ncbi:MAG: amino acid transporter [Gemmatimonadetes bacterium]|nr:amino acid transporter [Gemmatimonadota bacterium]
MSLRTLLFGRALRSEEQEEQKIGPLRGIAVLGLDALASASYGPEAALTILLGLGAASIRYVGPIIAVIVAVLLIVYLSYRQTIAAYPGGGGSYTVARENLGPFAGLVAASALAIDYVLNAAVAISAGVGAIISALPALQPYTLALCLAILAVMTVVNLRGVRESGVVFMAPTAAFVGCLGLTLAVGVVRSVLSGGAPVPVVPPAPLVAGVAGGASLWLLLHAFANGCTAMTGVEAVSNGVPLFKEPTIRNARLALTLIIAILTLLLGAIAYLSSVYHVGATPPGRAGYQSVLSQVVAAVMGRGTFYYVTLASIVAVLSFSANTSFAGFPRLCRVLALDEYLPAELAHLGRRLVYSQGVLILSFLSGLLLVIFGGVTDHLIPLFAVGAFLAFTMSQLGMVVHWGRVGGPHAFRSRLLNATGAAATGATLVVVVVSKFMEGAWITFLAVPVLVSLFHLVRRNYRRIEEETEVSGPLQLDNPPPPVVVIPLKRLDRVARKSIRLAISISPDVHVVQVRADEPNMGDLPGEWRRIVEEPCSRAGYAPPRLVVLRSSYRQFIRPLTAYVRQVARENPHRYVAVVVPEVVERRWYHLLLHSHRPALLKAYLFLKGGPRVIVINAPWYLRDTEDDRPASPGDPGRRVAGIRPR